MATGINPSSLRKDDEGAGTTAAILVAGAVDPLAAFGLDPALAVVMGKLLDQVVIDMAGRNYVAAEPIPQNAAPDSCGSCR